MNTKNQSGCNTDNNGWNICLSRKEGNEIIPSENNPTESGTYLCTCVVRTVIPNTLTKRVETLYWANSLKRWQFSIDSRDISILQMAVLAWRPTVEACDFDDFEYCGGHLIPKEE